jgi:hypothetical protein
VGTTYFDGKYRMSAEYYTADGMIFAGTTGAALPGAKSNDGTITAGFNVQTDQKANAYYIDLGYRVKPNFELDYRYDRLNSGTDKNASGGAGALREFTNHTIGFQYFANRKTIIRGNYEIRDINAPNSNATINKILDSIDNRLGMQVTVIY